MQNFIPLNWYYKLSHTAFLFFYIVVLWAVLKNEVCISYFHFIHLFTVCALFAQMHFVLTLLFTSDASYLIPNSVANDQLYNDVFIKRTPAPLHSTTVLCHLHIKIGNLIPICQNDTFCVTNYESIVKLSKKIRWQIQLF